jgi:hypothetical protein
MTTEAPRRPARPTLTRTLLLLLSLPLLMAALPLPASAATADGSPETFRQRAAVTVSRPGALIELPLPTSIYTRAEQSGLQDLRLIDAKGDRVPFALLSSHAATPRAPDQRRPATLYALPPGAASSTSPGGADPTLDIHIKGNRLYIHRIVAAAGAGAGGEAVPVNEPPAGWLIDLGARPVDQPAPTSIELQWPEAAEFSAVYDLSTSDDLHQWRAAGSGQLMALHSAGAQLAQRNLILPANAGRYLRLTWADASTPPQLTGATALVPADLHRSDELTSPLVASPGKEPSPSRDGQNGSGPAPAGALHFDMGGVVPLRTIDLDLPPGTRVTPVQWQGRQQVLDLWQPLGAQVHYRLERRGELTRSAPLSVETSVRYLRAIPDERAGALDPAQTRLIAQTPQPRLVFVNQGQPPYTLLTGNRQASTGALPLSTLIAEPEVERSRFGQASLGEWLANPDAVQAADRAEQTAALRPWLLWGVLLLGVAALGGMVWRLTRTPARR